MLRATIVMATLALAGFQSGGRPAEPGVPPSTFQGLHWRFIGPYRAGWATVAAGIPDQPNTYYFGGAGGGVWKTTDAGRTWQGLMQHETSSAIGALAIAPSNPQVIYVGTGQVAARYDAMAGDGVYRSADGGETWKHVGLDSTRHIGAILVDPKNADRVLVAALGHMFGPNAERGVYLSTDGGATWQHVLALGDSVGAVDLAWDPEHPAVVYAAAWQMRMHPWMDYFQPQAGPGSGIYKSTDGGATWTRLDGHGLPSGMVGRIGLGVARGSAGRIVYATIALEGSPLTGAVVPKGKSGIYRSNDGGTSWQLVNDDGSLASSYFGRITVAPYDSNTIYATGRSIEVSHDGGKHFTVFKGSPGGDDYHDLWINPIDPTHMIEGADQGAAVTVNGGKAWSSWYNQPTGQLYHLGVDDQFPHHVYSGQQDNGTVELTSRGPYGVIDERDWHPVGGDERDDMLPKPGDPAIVIGSGLGGHTSRFDEVTRQSAEISPWPVSSYGARPTTVKYRYTWITPLAFSPIAPHALYMGSQVLFKSLDDGDHWETVSPDLSGKAAGAKNCQDPNFTEAKPCGFGVIFTINPSPIRKGLIWIGTDDGLIHVTHDDGAHWTNVTPAGLPTWARINDVDPSAFDTNVAYAAVDLHRMDRFQPMAFKTTDGGKTWTSIIHGLPADEYVSVIRADPVKRGLLFAGTNRGVYVSFDDGRDWQPLRLNFPTTWVRDLLVHDGDLIAATQGRGIWILDDIEPLREITAPLANEAVHLFEPATAIRMRNNENRDTPWPPSTPVAENPPTGAVIDYWLGPGAKGPVTLTFRDAAGNLIRRFSSEDKPDSLPADRYFQKGWIGAPAHVSADPGMHRFVWDLRYPRPKAISYGYSIAAIWQVGTPLEPRGPLAPPGRYTVTLTVGGHAHVKHFTVRLDPRVHVTQQALREQLAFCRMIDSTLNRAVEVHDAIGRALADEGKLNANVADSLSALDGGDHGIANTASTLASLVTAVQGADAAPTQGDRDVYAAYRKDLDAALDAWRRLESQVPTEDR
ncbi:MAG TPA: hypothetical protein VJ992_09750 [Gemmatimonadales bacterium]|nr:hypothetical protein [Gemmatimonadales bacterium]